MDYHTPAFRWVIPGVLARSGRPGFPNTKVDAAEVDGWIAAVLDEGIRSIICLLHDDQVGWWYRGLDDGLLARYRDEGLHVIHFNALDSRTPPFHPHQLPPIHEAFVELPKPVLIHCSLGKDRTGQAVEYILERLSDPGADPVALPSTIEVDGLVFRRYEV